jgi:hypothetical protein
MEIGKLKMENKKWNMENENLSTKENLYSVFTKKSRSSAKALVS